LHLGHRNSIDFDFFGNRALDISQIEQEIPFLKGANIIQREKNTLSAIVDRGAPVKVSFFGLPKLPRLSPPFVAIIDPRSWAYWNSKMGRYPAPPLPQRRFGEGDRIAVALADSDGQDTGASSSCDPRELRRVGREAWLKMRQQQPQEDLEHVRRRAREDWLAQFGPEAKK
jgi:hypothetical protein